MYDRNKTIKIGDLLSYHRLCVGLSLSCVRHASGLGRVCRSIAALPLSFFASPPASARLEDEGVESRLFRAKGGEQGSLQPRFFPPALLERFVCQDRLCWEEDCCLCMQGMTLFL